MRRMERKLLTYLDYNLYITSEEFNSYIKTIQNHASKNSIKPKSMKYHTSPIFKKENLCMGVRNLTLERRRPSDKVIKVNLKDEGPGWKKRKLDGCLLKERQ